MTRAGRAYLKAGYDHLSSSYFTLARKRSADALSKIDTLKGTKSYPGDGVVKMLTGLWGDARTGIEDVERYRLKLGEARGLLMGGGGVKGGGGEKWEEDLRGAVTILRSTVLPLSPGGTEGAEMMARAMCLRGQWTEVIKFMERWSRGVAGRKIRKGTDGGILSDSERPILHGSDSHKEMHARHVNVENSIYYPPFPPHPPGALPFIPDVPGYPGLLGDAAVRPEERGGDCR